MIRQSVIAIWVNGRGLSFEATRRIVKLTFTDKLKKADSGDLILRDPDLSLFDSRIFKKGQILHFMAGWVDEVSMVGPFVVKAYKMSFPSSGESTLSVKFQDLSHKMDKKKKRKKHVGRASDILKAIAKEHGLGYDIDSIDGLEFTEDFPLTQSTMSDAELLQRLADRYGYYWAVKGTNLVFKRQADRASRKKAKPKVLSYKVNDFSISSFDPEVRYMKDGKRKGGNQPTENLDFMSDLQSPGDFLENIVSGGLTAEEKEKLFSEHPDDAREAVLIEESIGKLLENNVGEEFRKFYHEATDSAERLISWAAGDGYNTTAELTGGRSSDWYTKKMQSDVAKHKRQNTQDDPDAEMSIYDDVWELENEETCSAEAPNPEEAKRRRAASLVKRREIVSGKLVPTWASMRYRSGESVILVGLGAFFSGEYLVKEVSQSFTSSGAPFSSELLVARSRLGASSRIVVASSEKEDEIRKGMSEGYFPDEYDSDLDDAEEKMRVDGVDDV